MAERDHLINGVAFDGTSFSRGNQNIRVRDITRLRWRNGVFPQTDNGGCDIQIHQSKRALPEPTAEESESQNRVAKCRGKTMTGILIAGFFTAGLLYADESLQIWEHEVMATYEVLCNARVMCHRRRLTS